MSGAVLTAVLGAEDAPPNAAELATLLYGLHLAVRLLWTQDDDGRMAEATAWTALLAATAVLLARTLE